LIEDMKELYGTMTECRFGMSTNVSTLVSKTFYL
jgi:hypothetical protein